MAKDVKSKGKKKEVKLTAFEQELVETMKKVKEYKLSAEANIVSIIYKDPESLYNLDLKLEDFSNNIWRVYFNIASDLILKEKKPALDDITVGLYLEKHAKLREKYDEYGGYETLQNAKEYVKIENLNGYVSELQKWIVVIKLIKMKFPVQDRLSDFADMSAEDIYDEYESKLNHVFVNLEGDIKSYNLADNLDELIDELDGGLAVGLPFYNTPLITKETGGMLVGNITLIGALSNVGKSTFARNTIIPSIIEQDEKIVIMLNEDGLKKWQREFLVWTANNILHEDIQKYVVRDGKYSDKIKDILHRSADWLRLQQDKKQITIIPFKRFSTAQAIKIIKKYASMGVSHFMIDTFKNDAGKVIDNSWMAMMQNMVELYDIVKPDVKNLHLTATFQLEKGKTARQRYYSQDNIGIAKNMIDPASTCIMIRNLFEDEFESGKNELKVYRLEGKSGKTKIPVKLDKNKHYQILFIVKNREGSAGVYQIVLEHDLSKNMLKEVGICSVPVDF